MLKHPDRLQPGLKRNTLSFAVHLGSGWDLLTSWVKLKCKHDVHGGNQILAVAPTGTVYPCSSFPWNCYSKIINPNH